MVKAGKWLRSLLTRGKKEKNQEKMMERTISLHLPRLPPPPPPPPPTTPNGESVQFFQLEKSVKQTQKNQFAHPSLFFKPEFSKAASKKSSFSTIQQIAAIKIQAFFRSFLARKALRALKGLVKLQAVVRGFLVRKEAAATLRSMHALLTAQVRARSQRLRMIEEVHSMQWREDIQTIRINHSKSQHLQDMKRNANKNIMEVDIRQTKANSNNKKSNPTTQTDTKEGRLFNHHKLSLAPSTSTESLFTRTRSISQHSSPTPRTRRISSSEASTSQEEPYWIPQDCSFSPNYMGNTKSSKAKARSQSAPRQRNDLSDSNQSGKHRVSVDGKSISRAVCASSPVISVEAKEKIPWPEEYERLVSNLDYYRFITA